MRSPRRVNIAIIALPAQATILTTVCRRSCLVSRDVKRTRSEEHTSELQSLMRISYAVFCLKKKKIPKPTTYQLKQQHHPHKAQKTKTQHNRTQINNNSTT